ncbi:general substrate transporter [Lipomyces tetrasporus]|uniref:General substrate transporter n=1 Tax=Lipomyces tetrasporus TaxID=54092 RepID=A0AAD7VUT4_9ASCO|nr:general substrate transporter [Lipomyces tetrasporus]KAJ8101575.1 general substrate transporter [Lipomyces tetrasporus]
MDGDSVFVLRLYRDRPSGSKRLRGSSLLYSTILLSSIGFSLVGYDNGLMGGFINGDPFNRTFQYPDASLLSTVVAIFEVGGFAGAFGISFVGDRLGRRQSIALGAIFMIIGAILQASAYQLAQMFVGRIISGIGIGVINSMVPILQAEVSPKATRGLYVAMYCSTLNFGIVTAYWLDFGLSYVDSELAWRFPTAFQIVYLLALLWLTVVVPESPRWLTAHDLHDDAVEVLAALTDREADDLDVVQEYNDILETVIMESAEGSGSWSDFYKSDGLQSSRRLWTAVAIQAFQQLGGINAIIYYSTTLFQQSIGFSPKMAGLMSGFLQTWMFIASFIPWFLIDKIGRKPLILGGILVQGAVMTVQTALIYQVQHRTNIQHSAAIGAAAMLFVFESAFTIGMQSTGWVYPSEILPLRLRAKGSAISTAANWISNFMVVEITPPAIENIGYQTYIIFTVFNVCAVPIVWFWFKETKGLSLEDVDLLFADEQALEMHRVVVEHVLSDEGEQHKDDDVEYFEQASSSSGAIF